MPRTHRPTRNELLHEIRDRDGRAGVLREYAAELERHQEAVKKYIRYEFRLFHLETEELNALTRLFIRTGKVPSGFKTLRIESKGDEKNANSGKTAASAG